MFNGVEDSARMRHDDQIAHTNRVYLLNGDDIEKKIGVHEAQIGLSGRSNRV